MGTKVLVLFETISLFRDLSVSLQSNNEYITEPNDDNGYKKHLVPRQSDCLNH